MIKGLSQVKNSLKNVGSVFRMLLGLYDPGVASGIICIDPDPDPSINKQKS
jgi:hypothetical protein